MSRRAVKRYEQQMRIAADGNPDDSSDDDEVTLQPSPKADQKKSFFALLTAEDSDPDDDSQPTDVNDENDDSAVHPLPSDTSGDGGGGGGGDAGKNDAPLSSAQTDQPPAPDMEAPSAKKKKRKKKKGRKRNDQPIDPKDDPDWIALNQVQDHPSEDASATTPGFIPASFFNPRDDDDVRDEASRIMKLIEEMAFPNGQGALYATSVNDGVLSALQALRIEPKLLNADAELKRLFGARVVESERRVQEASAAASARRRGARPSGRAALRRKISLVSPRESWMDHAPGLIMQPDSDAANDATPGVKYFRYAHEASYARIQDEYRSFVNTHDPNLLVQLSSRHPYHVDTLLQLAELFRQMGELDRAAEQIERALYVLEASWNVSFKPFDGSCRLLFDVLENRSLYVALFRYSQLLTRRGLHRTALEISKLLLNLDPEKDPMGMLMLSDSYALLSGEYEWILDMLRTYKQIPIEYFPNFAVSSAIATECMRLGMSGISNRGGSSSKAKRGDQSGKDTKSGGNDEKESVEEVENLLVDAILTFPMVVRPMLTAIENTSSVWSEFRLFDEGWYGAGVSDMGVLTRIARVYAERSKLIWNSGHNKDLLVRCARRAGQLDEEAGMGKDPRTGRLTSVYVSNERDYERVARCRGRRFEAAHWLGQSGLYRNVQIADFSDSTTNLPAEILAGDGGDQAVGTPRPREVTVARGAMEFLQSLLPWREARDARADGDMEE